MVGYKSQPDQMDGRPVLLLSDVFLQCPNDRFIFFSNKRSDLSFFTKSRHVTCFLRSAKDDLHNTPSPMFSTYAETGIQPEADLFTDLSTLSTEIVA